jgi:hypothetical protein
MNRRTDNTLTKEERTYNDLQTLHRKLRNVTPKTPGCVLEWKAVPVTYVVYFDIT